MAWRTIQNHGETWLIQPAAERRANAMLWQLMLSFRSTNAGESKVFWAKYPIESTSKSNVFSQAERISDEDLRDLLAEHVA